MRYLIEAIKQLRVNSPTVYRGEDCFAILNVEGEKGLSKEDIDTLLKEYKVDIKLPKHYKEFLSFSDGLELFDDGGFDLLSLKRAILSTDSDLIEDKILTVGNCYDCNDLIFMDCKTPEGTIYISEEGLDPLTPINMNFKEFLEATLCCSGYAFWTYYVERKF